MYVCLCVCGRGGFGVARYTCNSQFETLQLTVDYIGIGNTLRGTDIHTIEHCDFTVIYFERWDHVENMSVSREGLKNAIFWCQTAF